MTDPLSVGGTVSSTQPHVGQGRLTQGQGSWPVRCHLLCWVPVWWDWVLRRVRGANADQEAPQQREGQAQSGNSQGEQGESAT